MVNINNNINYNDILNRMLKIKELEKARDAILSKPTSEENIAFAKELEDLSKIKNMMRVPAGTRYSGFIDTSNIPELTERQKMLGGLNKADLNQLYQATPDYQSALDINKEIEGLLSGAVQQEQPKKQLNNITNINKTKDTYGSIMSALEKLEKKKPRKMTTGEQIAATLLGGLAGVLGKGRDWSSLSQVMSGVKTRKSELKQKDKDELDMALKKISLRLEKAKAESQMSNAIEKIILGEAVKSKFKDKDSQIISAILKSKDPEELLELLPEIKRVVGSLSGNINNNMSLIPNQ